jgi:hypothetical protein
MDVYKRRLITINANDGLDLANFLRQASLANVTTRVVNVE